MVVGDDAHKLRSICAWVNQQGLVECVLDPGSSVVSVSKDTAHRLGISYDPTEGHAMVAANGGSYRTLGVARDVPVELAGNIMIFLQMHVVDVAPYDVLLGRPFDVLMACTVKNERSGRQEIEVICPNTGQTRTIPTYPRGENPLATDERPKGFQTSRN